MSVPRIRESFRKLEIEHVKLHGSGQVSRLETLVRAFRAIQDKDPKDFDSFFAIAGYHGEPFRGAGWSNGNNQWWGGYCHHGNILFPTWHRAYLLRLETALQDSGVPGAEGLALPFWDECEEVSRKEGIPSTFGVKDFQLSDGSYIKNPLYSYVFQTAVWDNVATDTPSSNYTKHKNYETKRYPQSGLATDDAKAHNDHYSDPEANWKLLNGNVTNWLGDSIWIGDKKKATGIWEKYHLCLEVPNYTVFSNTSSAAQFNEENFDIDAWTPGSTGDAAKAYVPIESPHNSMHLAVGGFDIPGQGDNSPVSGANGDMGENDTASFDPIFFFHHCFIDYTFWQWQVKWKQTDALLIGDDFLKYPGTNSTDNQGATPGVPGNSWLTLDTALEPFTSPIGKPGGAALTSKDVVNIEKLGYTYGKGSLDPTPGDAPGQPRLLHQASPVLRVTGANRAASPGSFLMSVWADHNGDGKKDKLVGFEPILSRHHVEGCANCQTHLNVTSYINIHAMADIDNIDDRVEVRVHTRADPSGHADDNVQWKRTKGKAGAIFKP